MAIEKGGQPPAGQLPPPPGPTRPPPKPFGQWASRNPFKVAIAVIGGLAMNAVSVTGLGLFPGAPRDPGRDLPRHAIVFIEAGADVCWKVKLDLGRETHQGCGDAAYELGQHLNPAFGFPEHTRFFAQVHKTYRKRVTGAVTIVLVVGGEEVDRDSTKYKSAFVSY